MPTAGSSRRIAASTSSRRRDRRDEEDAIEEDASQMQTQDDVDEDGDEDDESPRVRRRADTKDKKGKAAVKGNVKEEKAVPKEEDDDDDERIDIESFQDQPLSRKDASNLVKLAGEWEQMIAKTRQGGIEAVPDVAAALADSGGEAASGVCVDPLVLMASGANIAFLWFLDCRKDGRNDAGAPRP
jgi:E3 SUMO-protein ligase NSE2